MNIDSIDELKKLAGLLNHNPVEIEVEPEETECGCDDNQSDSETMRKYMDATANMPIPEEDEEDLEEWANSTDHFDGEPRSVGQPKGAVVDTSLRRNLGAKGSHVTVDESQELDEGIKDKLKILALLGLTGLGANYALDATSAKNSPLGKALYTASQHGDMEAAKYLKNIDAIIDGSDTATLQMLNFKYLDEPAGSHTTESMMESYKMFKNKSDERQKQRVKQNKKNSVRATVGGGNLKGMETVEEAEQEIEKYNIVNNKTKKVVGSAKNRTRARTILDKKDNEYGSYAHSIVPVYKTPVDESTLVNVVDDKVTPLPNKKAYAVDKASETKKKVSLAPEPWKNKKEPIKESIDLTQLKKNAGLL